MPRRYGPRRYGPRYYGQCPAACHVKPMITFVAILCGIAMLATLGTLFAGMVGMVRGANAPGRSNALMRWRVLLQGTALGLFVILLLLLRSA